ncbi:MAG: hypothetical protein JRE58_07500 [Deltaproteobacteria bacterium]|nr:hypothetical protein [Deltaproteobacteria bacterium]
MSTARGSLGLPKPGKEKNEVKTIVFSRQPNASAYPVSCSTTKSKNTVSKERILPKPNKPEQKNLVQAQPQIFFHKAQNIFHPGPLPKVKNILRLPLL